jgi:hypothetical protein
MDYMTKKQNFAIHSYKNATDEIKNHSKSLIKKFMDSACSKCEPEE